MFIEIFPGHTGIVTWFAFCEPGGRCRVTDFLKELEAKQLHQWHKLIGRMKSFADMGWGPRTPFMKALQSKSPHTIYEIKSHQERVLFVRCENDAVAIDALQKKADWSQKDANRLAAAEKLADAAMAECKSRGRRK